LNDRQLHGGGRGGSVLTASILFQAGAAGKASASVHYDIQSGCGAARPFLSPGRRTAPDERQLRGDGISVDRQ